MQFRALLAFILTLLVVIVFQHLSPPPQKKPPSGKEEISKDVKTEDSKIVLKKSEEIKGAGKEIIVSTNLYTAIFMENGGRLKSFRLKRYKETIDNDFQLKELVVTSHLGEFSLETDFYGDRIDDFKTAVFRADKNSLILNGGGKKGPLNFEWAMPDGLRVIKIYSFRSDSYWIDLDVKVENFSARTIDDRLKVTFKNSPTIKKRFTFTGPAALINESLQEIKTDKINREKEFDGKISWVGYEDVYFISAIVPDKPQDSLIKIETKQKDLIYTSLISPPTLVSPQGYKAYRFRLYLGPKDLDTLKESNCGLERAVNFGFFQIIAKPLLYVLKFLYGFSHNYGLAIILLTIMVKIVFWPLTHKSFESMKAMQKLQPHMKKIREKYKNDREKMNKELMALYRTYKINPMSGCLPMLLQIPVFFALYKILLYAIEIRHAPFIKYLPFTDRVWLADLSAKDPFYITPIIMGVSMFIQQKMTPSPGDPTQQKFMMFLPIIFTFMFLSFPSGLVLYWLVNNVLSIGQQYCINRGISLTGVFFKMRSNKRIS